MTSSIPSRFQQSQFDRFAPTLGEVLRVFPQAVEIDPAPLSVETYSARFRDAITAKIRYDYRHPAVDDRKFNTCASSLIVSMRGDKVLVGTREALKSGTVRAVGQASTQSSDHVLNPTHLEHYCMLVHARAFSPPLSGIVVHVSDPAIVAGLEQRYDVGFVDKGEGKYEII